MTLPRLVALDVDGTLADPDGVIRQRTLDAVAAVRAADVEVVVATGRPWLVAERTIGEIGGAGWAVCSNGSMALRLTPGRGGARGRSEHLPARRDAPESVVTALRSALPGVSASRSNSSTERQVRTRLAGAVATRRAARSLRRRRPDPAGRDPRAGPEGDRLSRRLRRSDRRARRRCCRRHVG